jgi:ATP-dependent RNA helicase DeaD
MEHRFETLNLSTQVIEGLKKQEITQPTEIQNSVIPLALEGKDIVGQSHTGSGKTLAYLLPLFERIETDKREMQVIILTPTIELALQVEQQIKLLAANSELPVTSANIVGQVNIKRQIEKLKEKPHFIVGSTGRILELIKLRKINTQTVKTIVIDEADRLLDKDNYDHVKNVINTTMKSRQLMLFTASLNQATIDLAKQIMNNPEIIQLSGKQKVSTTIEHHYFVVDDQRDKIDMLRKLMASINPEKALVFQNKSDLIETLTNKLQYHHLNAFALYGNASKEDRRMALQGFRSGKIQILVASDIAARGLDIENLTHIFNFDLPHDAKDYLHRVGRTGRKGNLGTAITIVTKNEVRVIKKFERELKITIQEKEIFKGVIQDAKEQNNKVTQ